MLLVILLDHTRFMIFMFHIYIIYSTSFLSDLVCSLQNAQVSKDSDMLKSNATVTCFCWIREFTQQKGGPDKVQKGYSRWIILCGV